MSRCYLEIEFGSEPETDTEIYPLEIIRLAVENETEALNLYDQLKPSLPDRPHRAYVHICHHSPQSNAPCQREQIAP